jgi:hypothetical protein
MSYARQIDVFIDKNLSGAAQSALLARAARTEVARLQAQGRASLDYTVFVDGREGAAPETVKPGGAIIYQFSRLKDAAGFAFGFLVGRSPVGTDSQSPGRYRKSWVIFVNWRLWNGDLARMPRDAEVMIVNTQPYHRKLEMTRGGTKATLTYLCKLAVERKYKNVRASHVFVELPQGPAPAPYTMKGGFVSRRAFVNSRGRVFKFGKPKFSNKGDAMTYPAVILRAT